MNKFWVTFANTNYDAKRLGVQRLQYPLAMHVPALAFSTGNVINVSRKTDVFELGVELAVKVGKDVFQKHEKESKSVIASYHLVISATNKYHINGIKSRIVTPSDQDGADSEYYTRWWEGSNSISEEVPSAWDEIHGKDIELTGDGFSGKDKVKYYHSPADIIHFISNFNKLVEDTYVCIGHILRHELPIKQADGMNVKCLLPSMAEHQVKLQIIN